MSYKKQPELLDVLRRRGVSLAQWCKEFGLKTWDEVCLAASKAGMIPPGSEHGVFLQHEELKAVVDEAHDKAEKREFTEEFLGKAMKRAQSVPDMPDLMPPEPQTCTRGIHDGACNGYPAPDCQVYDEETGGTARCADFEAKVGMPFKEFLAKGTSTKPTKRSKPVKKKTEEDES